MKINPLTMPLSEPANANRMAPELGQQWRSELEEAQWQARQQIPAAQPAPQQPAADAGSPAAKQPAAVRPGVVSAGVAAYANRAPASVADARAATVTRAVGAALRAAPQPSIPAVDLGLAAVPDLARDLPLARAAISRYQAASVSRFAWTELPEWPSVVMNANVTGNRVSIVMRDESLSDDLALELFYRLRAHFAAAGLELGELTVNGRSVRPAFDELVARLNYR